MTARRRPDIRRAIDAAERERVYRFWYDTYVQEMKRPVKGADHERGLLSDCLEDHSTIYVAYADAAIVGTARFNLPSRGPLDYYEDLYRLGEHPTSGGPFAIGTKYMVSAPYRASPLPYELACAALVGCVRESVGTVYIDCDERRVGYYEALGFVEHVASAVHPEYDSVRVMKYDLTDPRCARGLLGRFLAAELPATS